MELEYDRRCFYTFTHRFLHVSGLTLPSLFSPDPSRVGTSGIRDKLSKYNPGRIPDLGKHVSAEGVYEISVVLTQYLQVAHRCSDPESG